MQSNSFKLSLRLLAVVSLAVLAVACDMLGGKKYDSDLSITLNPESAGKEAGEVSVVVRASGTWILDLDFDGKESWAKLSHDSGTGYKSNIKLSYDANPSNEARKLYIIISTLNDSKEICFIQTADGAGPDGGKADATSCGWLELPETKSGDGLLWGWHSMTLNGKTMRNYSFYFSAAHYLSYWVAYPLNSSLMGGSGMRDKNFYFDPLLPNSMQADLTFSYRGNYDRGHQLPARDRSASVASNTQTFYATNMTPQRSQFNQKIWQRLEARVQSWASSINPSTDTLYVVTGCTVKGSTQSTTDCAGKKMTIPTAYYKAILRYTRSSGYAGCAIWLDHDTDPYRTVDERDMMSIAALEEKLGIDLFVNLPAKVGDAKAAEIEAKAPTVNTWPL